MKLAAAAYELTKDASQRSLPPAALQLQEWMEMMTLLLLTAPAEGAHDQVTSHVDRKAGIVLAVKSHLGPITIAAAAWDLLYTPVRP